MESYNELSRFSRTAGFSRVRKITLSEFSAPIQSEMRTENIDYLRQMADSIFYEVSEGPLTLSNKLRLVENVVIPSLVKTNWPVESAWRRSDEKLSKTLSDIWVKLLSHKDLQIRALGRKHLTNNKIVNRAITEVLKSSGTQPKIEILKLLAMRNEWDARSSTGVEVIGLVRSDNESKLLEAAIYALGKADCLPFQQGADKRADTLPIAIKYFDSIDGNVSVNPLPMEIGTLLKSSNTGVVRATLVLAKRVYSQYSPGLNLIAPLVFNSDAGIRQRAIEALKHHKNLNRLSNLLPSTIPWDSNVFDWVNHDRVNAANQRKILKEGSVELIVAYCQSRPMIHDLSAFVELLRSPSEAVVQAAAVVFNARSFQGDNVSAMNSILRDKDPRTRVRALKLLRDKRIYPIEKFAMSLRMLATSPNQLERELAIFLLSRDVVSSEKPKVMPRVYRAVSTRRQVLGL